MCGLWEYFRGVPLYKSIENIIKNEDTLFIKAVIIEILRDYAKKTDNLVDDALVDEFEKRLLFSK